MGNSFMYNEKNNSICCGGVDVHVFSDDYAAGHQSGINLIMHDRRMVNGGDVRLEQTPGQWQPVPARVGRSFCAEENKVTAHMHYPDKEAHLKGFNPLIYPDMELDYCVEVTPHDKGVDISVILNSPIPDAFAGKASFIMELVPCHVIGKSWIMDSQTGIFPAQPAGPVISQPANIDIAGVLSLDAGKADADRLIGDRTYYSPMAADSLIARPYASGHHFTALPESDLYCFSVTSDEALINLYDGRMNHNNGWFVICSELPVQRTGNVLKWYLEPRVKEGWRYTPVIQVSQVGYHPDQSKTAVLECDRNESFDAEVSLYRFTGKGEEKVMSKKPSVWGDMLRYRYAVFDFSEAGEAGLYMIKYKESESALFRIAEDIYDRGIWQPVLEYFLPVQMCHMLVREKYRIWHGCCHMDDGVMAPVDYNHFDGYSQENDTFCKYKPNEHVCGLNVGGWHDAGDYDIRVESQASEVYSMALAYEEFNVFYDCTTIDQEKHLVEIHRPDGRNDLLEQIEHGLLSIVSGYEALGRLYRGIISRDLRQYVLLGDAVNMTDGVESDDDRYVFTEDNPKRELRVAAQLAAGSRSMRRFNDVLSDKTLDIAIRIFEETDHDSAPEEYVNAAVELFLTTGRDSYRDIILANADLICEQFERIGWIVLRAAQKIDNAEFNDLMRQCAVSLNEKIMSECNANPYGVPYHPRAWGQGWAVQFFGMRHYFLCKAFPDIFSTKPMTNALDYVLGCHPGSNTKSFVSGVGAKSATVAYGVNRADNSYIPGGVISGTELIAPNFPELLDYPYLWQQSEYVIGGGSSHYLFLVLAVNDMLHKK